MDRLVDAEETERADPALRPRSLDEFVGQPRIVANLRVYIQAAMDRGEALDVGTSRRVATRAQRRALRSMHRTCVHPDCTVSFDACRIHHVVPWQSGGPTDLGNIVPVCEPHHHLVHEGGWGLTMASDRVATWTRPDGVHHHTGSTVDRSGDAARSTTSRTSQPTAVAATF